MLRDNRQDEVTKWVIRCFGRKALHLHERASRFLEESFELCQASGLPKEQALKLLDYVYSRPVGEPGQEIGGVGISLLALAEALSVSADAEELDELTRVLSKTPEHFRARHSKKVDQGIACRIEEE